MYCKEVVQGFLNFVLFGFKFSNLEAEICQYL